MKFVAKLPFIFFFASLAVFALPRSALAASPTARPEPSELVRPSSGSDTFKLASLGVVFLIIGAAVVYAPQIVSSITRLPRKVGGSRRKAPAKRATPAPKPAPSVGEHETTVIDLPSVRPPPVATQPVKVDIPGSPDVVSRLQNEIRSAWSKTR